LRKNQLLIISKFWK